MTIIFVENILATIPPRCNPMMMMPEPKASEGNTKSDNLCLPTRFAPPCTSVNINAIVMIAVPMNTRRSPDNFPFG